MCKKFSSTGKSSRKEIKICKQPRFPLNPIVSEVAPKMATLSIPIAWVFAYFADFMTGTPNVTRKLGGSRS